MLSYYMMRVSYNAARPLCGNTTVVVVADAQEVHAAHKERQKDKVCATAQ